MTDYKVYFYTAAQSGYANKILEILKLEMNYESKLVEQTFHPARLITRDDKHKYNQSEQKTEHELEIMRQAERNIINQHGIQAVTSQMIEREMWKMNYTRKTLDDLAGGDDKIFVVVDDRDDVWLKENG